MPPAWMVGPLVIKSSLVILLASFIIGMIFFKVISPFPRIETRKRLDEVTSVLMSFIVFTWLGKIFSHLELFLNDPVAILAYPSDSSAFYIAIIFTVGYAAWKTIKGYQHFTDFFFSFMNVFLAASFMYEFLQMVFGTGTEHWGYLGLTAALLVVSLLLQDRYGIDELLPIIIVGWGLGQLLISIFSTTAVFQFYLDEGFYGIILVSGLGLFFTEGGEIDDSGR